MSTMRDMARGSYREDGGAGGRDDVPFFLQVVVDERGRGKKE